MADNITIKDVVDNVTFVTGEQGPAGPTGPKGDAGDFDGGKADSVYLITQNINCGGAV